MKTIYSRIILTWLGALSFQLTAQNFGLLVTRRGQTIYFEQFELLAKNKDVMACQGRLRRLFPSTCIAMQYPQYAANGFTSAFAQCLFKLDKSTHPSSRPKSQEKGEGEGHEERDTVEPRLSAMLNGFLRGLGSDNRVIQIEKHSREEVLWHNSGLPWHRSATWLLIRVSLQLIWCRNSGAINNSPLFKGFIAVFIGSCVARAQQLGVPDQLMYCMLAKLDRRCQKLSQLPYFENIKPRWLDYCSNVQSASIQSLEQRWKDIQQSDKRHLPLEELKTLSFPTDSALEIPSLRGYLSEIQKAQTTSSDLRISPGSYAFLRTEGIEPPRIATEKGYVFLTLANFEVWIDRSLAEWLETKINEKTTCGKLSEMMGKYHYLASEAYKQNPFNLSVMWLSILELWVACDKTATHQVPLLAEYTIDVPCNLLQRLVLPSLSLMERLYDVESYLQKRHSFKPGHPHIFSEFGNPNSFAVQFYQNSAHHQSIHQNIVAAADLKETAKVAELAHMKTEYNQLQREYSSVSHQRQQATEDHAKEDYPQEYVPIEEICIEGCLKCCLEKRMTNMKISVYERPLPSTECEAKAVVFELQVPDAIAAWRNSTLKLLVDEIESNDSASRNPVYNLHSTYYYSELAGYDQNVTDRLQILSVKKPYTAEHGNEQPVSEATEASVCAPHGCQYAYYDQGNEQLRSAGRSCARLEAMKFKIPPSCSLANLSTFPLPNWIRGYSHTSNEIIAQQSVCPAYMTLESFKAFGHIRSGHRLQWRNILAQLAMPSVDFNQIDTALVVLQAISEAGPPCADVPPNKLRDSHKLLNERTFAFSLLENLRATFQRVRSSWECDVTMLVLSHICTRLLCTSRDSEIQHACRALLSELRFTARNWAMSLSNRADESVPGREVEDFSRRVLAMSLVCSSTFSADLDESESIFRESDSVTCFLEISILIHDHRQSLDINSQDKADGKDVPGAATQLGDANSQSPLLIIAMQSWRRQCYLFQPHLVKKAHQNRVCLDKAIGTFVAAYTPGMAWSEGGAGYQHIMTSNCCSSDIEENPSVTLDLLEGGLLIGGRPVSRLPPEYCQDSTFKHLFGEQSLKVSPSQEFDMQFTATREKEGWIIHFAMKNKQLVIRACNGGSK